MNRSYRRTLAMLTIGATAVLPAAASAGSAQAQVPHPPPPRVHGSGVWADFNGDGYRDIVVGAITDVVQDITTGSVVAMYGGAEGLSGARSTLLTMAGATHEDNNARFGGRTAIGDLDKDGFADLVVAQTAQSTEYQVEKWPSLTVFWGSRNGLTTQTAVPTPHEPYLAFGTGLTVADFDGDGQRDIAAIMNRTANGPNVVVVYKGGITRSGATGGHYVLTSDSAHKDIAAGDVNGDHISDLVVTNTYGKGTTPKKSVFYRGSKKGLVKAGSLPMGDRVAIGDVNRDGYADVAVGWGNNHLEFYAPVGWKKGGMVTLVYGAKGGPGTGRASMVIHQAAPGIPSAPDTNERMGDSLAFGDVNGDGYRDLAIGVPGDTVKKVNSGSVLILRGSKKGLVTAGAQSISQESAGVLGAGVGLDDFGDDVVLSDLDRDGRSDLVVAAPHKFPADYHFDYNEGAVWTMRGTSSGIATKSSTRFRPADLGIAFTLPYPVLGHGLNG